MRFSFSLSALAVSAPAILTMPLATANDTIANMTTYKNVGYFVNWAIYGRDHHPQNVPGQNLTHLLYSFADVNPDGTVKLTDSWSDLEKHYSTDSWNDDGNNAYGCVKQIYLLKKQNRQMKVLLSIGGWTLSVNFPAAASTVRRRAQFARTAVSLVRDLGLDGLDIDWEYPNNAQEAADYVLLLGEVRRQLDAYAIMYTPGYHYQITIASPAGPTHYGVLNFRGMDQYLDAWHLMAYDYAGSFSTHTGHNANLYPSLTNPASTDFSTERAITDYIASGIPADKIVLGLPLYGRYFTGTTGLGQPFAGMGEGSLPGEAGVVFYKDIKKELAAKVRFDEETGSSYWFDIVTGQLISYDDETVMKLKTEYIKEKGLGGAMFWDTSMDKDGTDSLIALVANGMKHLERSRNQLKYPASQYANVASGMAGGLSQSDSVAAIAMESPKFQLSPVVPSNIQPSALESSELELSSLQSPEIQAGISPQAQVEVSQSESSAKKSGSCKVTASSSFATMCLFVGMVVAACT